MKIEFRGQKVDKWVAIKILKEEGWRQTRCAAGDILYQMTGDQLTVVRIATWQAKNWDGLLAGDTKADAIWLAEDADIDWQE